jgi:hypothetical protein
VRVRTARIDDLELPEIQVETEKLSLVVNPAAGGALSVLDFTRRPLPLGCTLTRRFEAYHDEALVASRSASSGGAAAQPETASGAINIHERKPLVPPDLPRYLIADTAERLSLVERFFPEGTTPLDLMQLSAADLSRGEARADASARQGDRVGVVSLSRAVRLKDQADGTAGIGFDLIKEIRCVSGREGLTSTFRIRAGLEPGAPSGVLFAVEFNLAFVEAGTTAVGPGPGEPRTVSEAWALDEVRDCRFVETNRRFEIRFRLSPAGSVWHHPVRTVSRCEAGFELIYQGSAVILVWPLAALVGEGTILDLDVEDYRSRAGIVR